MKTALRIASTADGGYVAGQRFYAYYPDFQGNVHVVASDGEFLQSNHYYPYGLPFAEGVAPKFQPHKYSGKEFLSDRSLNLYDFHARLQDPIIGGFDRMDNLCEKYRSYSPYTYCLGNPLKYGDPDGNDIVIKGLSGSCITLATNLINISVDVSPLGINWGGNYTIQGEKVLSAVLDIVGIVDPTGAADILNATLHAKNNNNIDAAISIISSLPGGDVLKCLTLSKNIRIIEKAVRSAQKGGKAVGKRTKSVHGNSASSDRAQHLYEIFEVQTGKRVKVGISGGKKTKDGKSYRANRQVNKWNREAGFDKYNFPSGQGARRNALNREREYADMLRKNGELNDKKYHQRP